MDQIGAFGNGEKSQAYRLISVTVARSVVSSLNDLTIRILHHDQPVPERVEIAAENLDALASRSGARQRPFANPDIAGHQMRRIAVADIWKSCQTCCETIPYGRFSLVPGSQGWLPRGICKTQSSATNSMKRSRSWALNALNNSSRIATDVPMVCLFYQAFGRNIAKHVRHRKQGHSPVPCADSAASPDRQRCTRSFVRISSRATYARSAQRPNIGIDNSSRSGRGSWP